MCDLCDKAESTAINTALATTAVQSLRKIQRIVESSNEDLDLSLSIFAADGEDGDITVVVDGLIFAEIAVWTNDSPRTWMSQIRSAIRAGRRLLAEAADGIEFSLPDPSDN